MFFFCFFFFLRLSFGVTYILSVFFLYVLYFCIYRNCQPDPNLMCIFTNKKNCNQKKQNNNETQETLHGCLFVCVCWWWVEYESLLMRTKNIWNWVGNEKEMLLLVDQNTKQRVFFLFGTGKRECAREEQKLPSIPESAESARERGREIHRDGKLMRGCACLCVSVWMR